MEDRIYVRGVKIIDNGATTVDYFFIKESNTWLLKDSFLTDSQNQNYNFGPWFYKSNYNELYSFGIGGIYLWNNNNWENIFYHPSYGVSGMSKQSSKNILLTSFGGDIYHYNGSNWEELKTLRDEEVQYREVWLDDSEAFIIGNVMSDSQAKTIVLHGK